ncbi:DNA-binding transcriptional MerR regulator [Paenibacillus turicensis]|uniref:DNA-binding transcriptional MerR regulator n=1 Tax=Paenibacillus turicensis TaxID=160487 RepID=A0ABS4FP36_9BACL|nr:MerR family transcriptional regulator [Paenibacillus turicensis]MBP1904337.1 DNA-binding transcriptional MerR regulator [Paenibacillus turicensis]
MKIKELADLVGVSTATIRFYEEKELLHPSKHPNGYRYYTEADIKDLNLIIAFKRAAFSLNDIKTIVTLRRLPQSLQCKMDSLAFMQSQIKHVKEQITFLNQLMSILEQIEKLVDKNDPDHVEEALKLMSKIEKL